MKTALKTILVATALVGITTVAQAKEYVTETTKDTYFITTKENVGSENTTNRGYGDYYNSFSKDYRQPEPLASASVVDLQQTLAAQGYYKGDIDGIWGSKTTDAVRDYQEAHGWPVTGQLSAMDMQKMGVTPGNKNVVESTTRIYSSDMNGYPRLRD